MTDQDRRNIIGQVRRLELQVAWLQLDWLVWEAIGFSSQVTRQRGGTGVWRAWCWPAARGKERPVGRAAENILKQASQSKAGQMANIYSSRTVAAAKALTTTAIAQVSVPHWGKRQVLA